MSNQGLDHNIVNYNEKLDKVRSVLRNEEDLLESLTMIDALQRLAIDYHFQDEITEILSSIVASHDNFVDNDDSDLYNVSLGFRLFRQDGYHICPDMFNKFKDANGKFKQGLSEDLEGMMELYEAYHLGVVGESLLDEAQNFALKNLKNALTHSTEDRARVITDTLKHPYYKSLARFRAKHHIKNFEKRHGPRSDILLELAKVDFNIVQSLHQRELLEVSKWWKDLGLPKELRFARNQPVKWYLSSMASLSDPRFWKQRIELIKPISFLYVLDDIFDVYGTLDDLIVLTEAFNKWDPSQIEQLPHQMKVFFKVVYDFTDEFSSKVFEKHGWNPSQSLQKSWARLCNAFLVEAKWLASGELPSTEEYLKNGVISTGMHIVFVHTFFLLGQGITKKSVDLVDNVPGLITYTSTILRLLDDLGSAKDENQDGRDGSYIECCMKEHRSSTIDDAREHVSCMISDAWKCLSEECLSPNVFSPSLRKASLDATRIISLIFDYDEDHRLPTLEEHIKSLLYESIP
ncbi:hypothetical protein GIB67_003762 [Kingdonia uniflora]|uniref:Uncharacterized protein n=1 Tax=Kingdonia uniflora TaxID=39325 RepID=A0A7J7MST2_9MAGN|nr:hypothetical protein GIB67_003762 [Kingdonia uniflora]